MSNTLSWDEMVAEARRDVRFFEDLIEDPNNALRERGFAVSDEDLELLNYYRESGSWPVDRSELTQEQAQESIADQKEIAGISVMAIRGRWKRLMPPD